MSFLADWFLRIKNDLKPSGNVSEGSGYSYLFSILFSTIMFSIALRLSGVGFLSSVEGTLVPTHFLMALTGITFVLLMYLLKTIIIHVPVFVLGGRSVKKTFSITSSSTAAILPVISILLVITVGLLQVLSTLMDFSEILTSSYKMFLISIGLSGIFPLLYSIAIEKRKIGKLHGLSWRKSVLISSVSNFLVIGVASFIISSGWILILAVILTIPFGGIYIP